MSHDPQYPVTEAMVLAARRVYWNDLWWADFTPEGQDKELRIIRKSLEVAFAHALLCPACNTQLSCPTCAHWPKDAAPAAPAALGDGEQDGDVFVGLRTTDGEYVACYTREQVDAMERDGLASHFFAYRRVAASTAAPAEQGAVDRDRILADARLRASIYKLVERVEGVTCERWAAGGLRFKDTPEWVAFYVAAKQLRDGFAGFASGYSLLRRAYEVVHHDAACPAIGGRGDVDCECDAVPFLRDLAARLAPIAPDARSVDVVPAEQEGNPRRHERVVNALIKHGDVSQERVDEVAAALDSIWGIAADLIDGPPANYSWKCGKCGHVGLAATFPVDKGHWSDDCDVRCPKCGSTNTDEAPTDEWPLARSVDGLSGEEREALADLEALHARSKEGSFPYSRIVCAALRRLAPIAPDARGVATCNTCGSAIGENHDIHCTLSSGYSTPLARSVEAGLSQAFSADTKGIVALLTWIAERADMRATGYKFTYNEELPPTPGFPREVWDAIERLKL